MNFLSDFEMNFDKEVIDRTIRETTIITFECAKFSYTYASPNVGYALDYLEITCGDFWFELNDIDKTILSTAIPTSNLIKNQNEVQLASFSTNELKTGILSHSEDTLIENQSSSNLYESYLNINLDPSSELISRIRLQNPLN